MKNSLRASFVVPVFNESAILETCAVRLIEFATKLVSKNLITENFKIIFVDDGSTDKTAEVLSALGTTYPEKLVCLHLEVNRGQQQALIAGMRSASENFDVCITLDADLQDEIHKIEEMLDLSMQGFDFVAGVRRSRRDDGVVIWLGSTLFYFLLKVLCRKSIASHAEFRLLTNELLSRVLNQSTESTVLRVLVPSLSRRPTTIVYDRQTRIGGKSKYGFLKLLRLALQSFGQAIRLFYSNLKA